MGIHGRNTWGVDVPGIQEDGCLTRHCGDFVFFSPGKDVVTGP